MVYFNALVKWMLTSLIFFQAFASAQAQVSEIDELTKQVDSFYLLEKHNLPFDSVIELATKIVPERLKYEPNTLAKVYALIADVALIKGESSRAFQLALFGLSYQPISVEVKLDLQLKLASGYFFKNQFYQLIESIEEVILLAEREEYKEYRIRALAYRAMAHAFLGEHQKSVNDLRAVEVILEKTPAFSDHVELYEFLAISQHILGNHSAALILYDNVLEKRFKIKKLQGIETTYTRIGNLYLEINKLDDAYNAYWESKRYAVEQQLPIKIAYAELGLGKVLLRQEKNEQAFKALVEAESLFKGQNLNKAYLDTLIELAIASKNTGRDDFSEVLILQAKDIAELGNITHEHAPLFQLLAAYYEQNKDFKKALRMIQRYVSLKAPDREIVVVERKTSGQLNSEQSKIQALKVVETSETQHQRLDQLTKQKKLITVLAICFVVSIFMVIYQWLTFRRLKLSIIYDQNERPADVLPNSIETKQLYHQIYKKARKYEYPLSIAYIRIRNWQDLMFQYNRKTVTEVSKTIATIVNEHKGEFDYAGQISEGEYLLMFPHQVSTEAAIKMDKLINALKGQFFANAGEFSVGIEFSIDTPSVQDIDPYIFLSRLSEI